LAAAICCLHYDSLWVPLGLGDNLLTEWLLALGEHLVRVGLIETNSALLSSASLHPDVVDRLFELLLGQLVIAQDGTLRQISCQLLTTRLQIYASSEVLAHR